jgi:predicted transposase YbfD/YdcC
MADSPVASLVEHFAHVADPRSKLGKRHLLLDIIVMAICAVICGADDWPAVVVFGHSKEAWLRTFLRLPHGIPSEDTFRRVLGLVNPEQLQQHFRAWIDATVPHAAGQVIPIDGKTLRRSHDRTTDQNAIHMVSAWATAEGLVLGQLKVDAKSNEIPAIPELLQLLDIAGCIITVDAIGCQRDIAAAVIAQEADYMLAVKGNQPELEAAIAESFAYAASQGWRDVVYDEHQTLNKDHGRIETRHCWTIQDPDYLYYVRQFADWPQLNTIVKVQTERCVGADVTEKTRYFITSLGNDAPAALRAVREHWGIENQLHWRLDVVFREDDSRLRKGHGAENFAVLRHIALSLLQQERSSQLSVKSKRLRAALDENYLRQVLRG